MILTPTALDRCNEPGDWLRREIETAIDEKHNIIPLFFDGFNFGSPAVAEKLTGKLGTLRRYNGLDIPSGYFIEAMERLSNRYLNIPLNAVIHPVSTDVRKVVKEEQVAANNALIQKWEDIKELLKPAEEKSLEPGPSETAMETQSSSGRQGRDGFQRANLRLYGVGISIILLVVAGIASITALLSNNPGRMTPTMTSQIVQSTMSVEASGIPEDTPTVEIQSSTPTEAPTLTVTSSPTLGIDSTRISPKDGMILVYVSAGKFTMGNNVEERPERSVDLDAFWIDQTEVTNRMYAKCVHDDACNEPLRTSHYSNPIHADHPVVFVSWDDAIKYCAWAERKLPTEAEWKKAARGKNAFTYPWGNDSPNNNLLNYNRSDGDTTEVGKYPDGASPYGALDMAGNVWEWVSSLLQEYPYATDDGREDLSASGPRVVRGGAWDDVAYTVRSANRAEAPITHSKDVGFRYVLPVSQ